MSEALRRLGEVSKQLAVATVEFQPLAVAAAQAEATHKHARAVFIVNARAEGVRSVTEAEYQAEADEAVHAAHLDRLLTAALVDSAKQRLYQLRTAAEVGRSFRAAEGESDRTHQYGGAA